MTAIQGFVFTVFAITFNSASNASTEVMSNWIWIAVMVLCIIGRIVPWLFFKTIANYGVRLQEIREYWKNLGHEGFPPLKPEPINKSVFRLETLPVLATIAWVFALAFSIVAFFLKTSNSG